MLVRILITESTRSDYKEAIHLIQGISADALLANRGYDTDEIIGYALDAGMEVVIPSKQNHREQWRQDHSLFVSFTPFG